MASPPPAPQAPTRLTLPEALERAHAHWNAGQAQQAQALCRNILDAVPGQSDALHLLGLMAHAYGELDRAIGFLTQACAAPQAPAVFWSNLAEMLRQRGQLVQAEAAARTAVERGPGLAGAWNNLGIILQEMGRYDASRACLDKVLEWQPDNAELLNNLGNTCMRQGETVLAERYWRRALELRPGYAQAHSNLGKLLGERGRHDEAVAHGRRAVEIEPQFAEGYINLAGAEKSRGRDDEALRWLNALLAFHPGHATALASRAVVLTGLERLPEALEAAQRALAAAPESAEAQVALAGALKALGREDEALHAYARAAALPGTKAEEALIARAALLMEMGRKADAEAAFERALEAFPRSASAWHSRADMHRFSAGDPLIARMQALFERGDDLLPNDRMALHFALGKALLDAGESAQAFVHLDAGNALKRATFDYAPQTASALVERTIEGCSAARLHALGGLGLDAELPVFVVGMPRSGTTLTEQILASHPQVRGAGELSALTRLVSGLAGDPQALARLDAARLRELGNAYLEVVRPLAGGARHVVDKMPSNFFYAGLIHLMFPRARIIHCRRDAVDTCLSCYTKLFGGEQRFAFDQRELGLFHLDYQRLMAHWRAVLPPSCLLEVDYEAVVDDLEGQARRMLEFLGLPWDPACLDFHRTARTVRTASVNQVREPLYKTSAGRWRRHAAELGPLLEALGRSAD
jgi:tetratricopeptide (TPR) repeat protein